MILATGELSELDELKRDSDVIALRELRSARAVVAKRLEEISQNHRICPWLHSEVHGIGAVRAAELVERGIRSLLHLREAVAKNQACLSTLSPPQGAQRRVSNFCQVHLDAAQALHRLTGCK